MMHVIRLDKSGTQGNRINYWAYENEQPVFDFSAVKPNSELFIEDADDDQLGNGGSMVDPVYVGGFPPVVIDPNATELRAAPEHK